MALIDLTAFPIHDMLANLLQDKTTGKNILWGTDDYATENGHRTSTHSITTDALVGINHIDLQPRCAKNSADQLNRTRENAEVFTPVWICNKMNNHCDEEWFGYPNVFNTSIDETKWTETTDKVSFPGAKTWKDYIDSRRIEITCGEAPFIVSRYDSATGDMIVNMNHRIGILDRKLRIVTENNESEEDWCKWAIRALQSCYGYEFQGDNLLIARINILLSICEWYEFKWNKLPTKKLITESVNIIVWNFWQMDGFTGTIPFGKVDNKNEEDTDQMLLGLEFEDEEDEYSSPCRIYDWRARKSVEYKSLEK